jgi:hypothetical protein
MKKFFVFPSILLLALLLLAACGVSNSVEPEKTSFPPLYTRVPPTETPMPTETPIPMTSTPWPEESRVLEKWQSVSLFRASDGVWINFENQGQNNIIGCFFVVLVTSNIPTADASQSGFCGQKWTESYSGIIVESLPEEKVKVTYPTYWEVR